MPSELDKLGALLKAYDGQDDVLPQVIERLRNEMNEDEDASPRNNTRFLEWYMDSSPEIRAVIDNTTTYFCGWEVGSLLRLAFADPESAA
jgi:hypothetical protein